MLSLLIVMEVIDRDNSNSYFNTMVFVEIGSIAAVTTGDITAATTASQHSSYF